MEEERGNRKVWIIVGIIALLVVWGLSLLAAGGIGYFVGRKSTCYIDLPTATGPSVSGSWGAVPEFGTPEMPRMPDEFDFSPMTISGGVIVTEVIEDSPAERAGLRAGDIILEFDGQPLDEEETLSELIGEYDPGDEVELLVRRVDSEYEIEVELGRHPDLGGETAWLGIYYRPMPAIEFRFEMPDRQRDFQFHFESDGQNS